MQETSNNQLISLFLKDFSKNPDFKFITKFYKAFPKGEIYLVGGKVRDILLQRASADYDFVVRLVEPKALEKFLAKEGKVNFVGKSFGVFRFVPKKFSLNEEIDIALPRTEESFLTGGYRDFDIQTDPALPIEEDLKRRDRIESCK